MSNDFLADVTIAAYGVAAGFGILFLIALMRTDWYRHPWGRNVFAFMACLVPLELFAFSRRWLGDWPGQIYVITLLSAAIAVVTMWRWWLQVAGNRRARADAHRRIIQKIARGARREDPSS